MDAISAEGFTDIDIGKLTSRVLSIKILKAVVGHEKPLWQKPKIVRLPHPSM